MSDNDIKAKVVQILRNTDVSFLLGAGTSHKKSPGKACYPLMSDLVDLVRSDKNIQQSLAFFSDPDEQHRSQASIVKKLVDDYLYSKNSDIEKLLTVLEGLDIYITNEYVLNKAKEFRKIVKHRIITSIFEADKETVLPIYTSFYRGLRELKSVSSKPNYSINIFTTNYDMLNEEAMEEIGTHYYSGFSGIVNRKFEISNYKNKYVSMYNLNSKNYAINDNHVNLYKLHGSISWTICNGDLCERKPDQKYIYEPEIIYPSIAKFDNTNLIVHYSSLMREFSNLICQTDTTLVVCGSGLNDEHINKIIANALLINSFTLIIFSFDDSQISHFKEKYSRYQNVIVYDNPTSFEGLSEILLGIGDKDCE